MTTPQQAPSQNAGHDTAAPKETTHSDPSGAICSMYMSRVQKFDEKNVENWKGGADGILVFTGLFSSTVATFIALSYPNLQQDPNVTTQLLLLQISQQLSNTTTGDHSSLTGVSIPKSFVLPASVVFINSVWFLSLVLSLTCALMATLLQQWARRYLQIVQQRYAPLHYVRIHEYFSRGARRFGIFGFVEVLPLLLLLSVLLFFAGLVVFAFRGNHVVAHFTLAIVGFCTLSYIALTLMPLMFHDCPYQTPLTSVLWFSTQIITNSFSVLYHGAKLFPKCWAVRESIVKSSRRRQKNKPKSLSENIISKLESSADGIPMDTAKRVLTRTLHWLNEDHELEEFVAGIPGLCESEAFSRVDTDDGGDVQRKPRNIRAVLAALPGPTNFHVSFSRSIMGLAQRAITSDVPKFIQQQRTRTCLRTLYYIPGAIRDVLAPYAAGKHYCLEVLPLLNSPESLEIIDELWNTPNDDVALSVRCAAAVVAAFMITPPRRTLDTFVTPFVGFIGDNNTGKQFLAKRLRVGPTADGGVAPEFHPNSDTGRLQNIVRFLADIKDTLQFMNTQWWASDNAESIRRERQELFDKRHTEEYVHGHGTFYQQSDRTSPTFVPAAQQDLITLTLEILARDPVANAAASQRDAFRDVCTQLGQEATTQARTQARRQTQAQPHVVLDPRGLLEDLALRRIEAADSIGMVRHALEPVFLSLSMPVDNMHRPHEDSFPSHIPVLQVASTDWPYSESPSAGLATGSADWPSSAGPATNIGGSGD